MPLRDDIQISDQDITFSRSNLKKTICDMCGGEIERHLRKGASYKCHYCRMVIKRKEINERNRLKRLST